MKGIHLNCDRENHLSGLISLKLTASVLHLYSKLNCPMKLFSYLSVEESFKFITTAPTPSNLHVIDNVYDSLTNDNF